MEVKGRPINISMKRLKPASGSVSSTSAAAIPDQPWKLGGINMFCSTQLEIKPASNSKVPLPGCSRLGNSSFFPEGGRRGDN